MNLTPERFRLEHVRDQINRLPDDERAAVRRTYGMISRVLEHAPDKAGAHAVALIVAEVLAHVGPIGVPP